MLGTITWALDWARDWQQRRRRVNVLVHQGVFLTAEPGLAGPPHYFVKVTNLGMREVVITHVWVDGDPQVPLLQPQRPLPARLRPDEQWEAAIRADEVKHIPDPEWKVRVRLSSGRTVKSRRNRDVPPVGFMAGPGSGS
jgi:hypothetical protein